MRHIIQPSECILFVKKMIRVEQIYSDRVDYHDKITSQFCHDKPNEFIPCAMHAVCYDGQCVTFDGDIIYDFCYDKPNEPLIGCAIHGVCYNGECVDIGDL